MAENRDLLVPATSGSWLAVSWQIALMVLLFLGSLGVLLFALFSTMRLPQQELDVRRYLEQASDQMARSAGELPARADLPPQAEPLNGQLREVSQATLEAFPGVEGGFYVVTGQGWFGGYAFPTGHSTDEGSTPRNDPPPLERALIEAQVQRSLDLGEKIVRTEEVGPSRVIILTQPVGRDWPAPMSTWLLYRLTGPKQLMTQLAQYRLSTYLALAGIFLAVGLTWQLGRRVRQQRIQQEQLRDGLQRAERLAALGRLVAGVAHEVRNPLAAIRSTVQLWQRLPETVRNPGSLEAVIASVDRLNGLVGRLLLFARGEGQEREVIDIHALLGDTLDLLQAQAVEQGVTIERDFAIGEPRVFGIPDALRQVALNLLTNALQSIPAPGRVGCQTRVNAPEQSVEILFADTGPGIPAEARQRLFEPFFTTRADGTGLGLALCREIVVQHGGRIELVEQASPGATFRVVLPLAPAQ